MGKCGCGSCAMDYPESLKFAVPRALWFHRVRSSGQSRNLQMAHLISLWIPWTHMPTRKAWWLRASCLIFRLPQLPWVCVLKDGELWQLTFVTCIVFIPVRLLETCSACNGGWAGSPTLINYFRNKETGGQKVNGEKWMEKLELKVYFGVIWNSTCSF